MNAKTKTFSIDLRVKLFWLFSTTIAISLAVYCYAVLATIHHTITKKNVVEHSTVLANKVSELEFVNIAMKNDVNINRALEDGYTEVINPIYISRVSVSLTLNTEGR